MSMQIQLIVGPLVAGAVFNVFLFGICIVQFVIYITSGLRDRLATKLVIYWVILLDLFQTASLTWMLWVYVVDNFNNPAVFVASAPWPFPLIPIVNACNSVPIQHFLAWRVKHFTSSNKLFIVLSFLSLAQGALAITSGVLAFLERDISKSYKIIPTVISYNVTSIVCDVCITYFLIRHLRMSRTGHNRTDNVLTKIIIKSIETAAIPLFFCIMDFITFTVFKDTTIHLIFGIPMARVYTNTLLLNLNSRARIRRELRRGMRGTNIDLPTLTSPYELSDPSANRADRYYLSRERSREAMTTGSAHEELNREYKQHPAQLAETSTMLRFSDFLDY